MQKRKEPQNDVHKFIQRTKRLLFRLFQYGENEI